MNNQPKITVYIPTYNRCEMLKKALDSAVNQTYQNIEIFISDNHSEDSTQELCLAYANKDSRIRYHRHKENIGIFANGVSIWNAIQTEYCISLCDDDWLSENYVEEMVQIHNKFPQAKIIFPICYLYDENYKLLHKAPPVDFLQEDYTERILSYIDLVGKWIIIAALYHTKTAQEAFGNKVRLCEDQLFNTKMLFTSIAPCAKKAVYHKLNNGYTKDIKMSSETFSMPNLTRENYLVLYTQAHINALLQDSFYDVRLSRKDKFQLAQVIGEEILNKDLKKIEKKIQNTCLKNKLEIVKMIKMQISR